LVIGKTKTIWRTRFPFFGTQVTAC